MSGRVGPAGARGVRDAGASEVVGGVLLLTITLAMFVVLSSALLQQARDTAAYIRSLVPQPEGEGTPVCAEFPEGVWCRRPAREPSPGELCVLDSLGWQWCLDLPGRGRE